MKSMTIDQKYRFKIKILEIQRSILNEEII